MNDRTAAASAIRDHIVALMEQSGEWQRVGDVRLRAWKSDGFMATLNSPFNPMPNTPVAAPGDFVRALAMQRARKELPFSLSVWRGGKVLYCEWSDAGEFQVITFKRGPWERELLAIPTG